MLVVLKIYFRRSDAKNFCSYLATNQSQDLSEWICIQIVPQIWFSILDARNFLYVWCCGKGMYLIVSLSPWKWIPHMSAPFINFSRWFLIWFSKQLLSNRPCTVSIPGSLQFLETFLAEIIIALNVSSYPILNWRSLLNMVIPINEVSLASAAEKILTEVTDTVDNIDDQTPWSLNVDVWFLLTTSYWSKRSNKIYSKQGRRGYLKENYFHPWYTNNLNSPVIP